ncbi:substrate-binding domain-containing protein [Ancylobacter sp. TS-1]|uniref:substrate-binding domain-containing protein n=1 Tax=Ancylobacter sp. TS-1 TaxID=1850374 RepID=UPI001265BBF9|nr:substrate-binding domain-containing protein [Ancylobacter sp. TS-1]QFR32664.1 ABC transporter substrate-binding protein [Ancylobacter sp. TS-1]
MTEIRIFSAGAAKGYVEALAARFETETSHTALRTYGPVGAIVERLRGGETADIVILSEKALLSLAASGATAAGIAPIGYVDTCVAVRAGDPPPPLGTVEDVRAAFAGADAIHLPDPAVATSGAHVMDMLRALGLAEQIADRLRIAANGIVAMTEMGASTAARPIGCTQASEIALVGSVGIAAPLPPPYALTTLYAAALTPNAANSAPAAHFMALLAGAETAPLRARMGFQAA